MEAPGAAASLGGIGSTSMELLTGGEVERAGKEAELASPGAVAEQERSRVQYEGLNGGEAVSLAEKDFAIQRAGWRAPGSEPGTHIARYLNSDEADEVSASGQHLLVASSVPLLSSVGSGKEAPTSLALEESGSRVYVPKNPVVPVSISKSAAGGASLPLGYGVAPVEASGGEASRIVGDRVVYPGSAKDTMYMVEPIPEGVETSWQLLSQEASGENSLRFTLPEGASLRLSETSPGSAEVVKEGQRILLIPQAAATQADGVGLPVTYSVSGDVLTTHVDLSGSVDFPVMVDPIVAGAFGTFGPSGWVGWTRTESACKCFGVTENEGLLRIGEEGNFTNNEWGEWYIWSPNAGSEGGSLIERVDLTGLSHEAADQSYMEEEMYGSNGSPVWTFNGTEGAQGSGTLITSAAYSNVALAMCADGAGGKDGAEQPLCNENYGAKAFAFSDVLGPNTRTVPNYVQITGAVVRYLDTTPPNQVEMLSLPKGWVQYGPTNAYIYGHDQGIGMQAFTVEIPPGYRNSEGKPFYAYENGCYHEPGFAGCALSADSSDVNLSGLETGVHPLGVRGYDAVGNVREEQPAPVLYVDHTPPHIEALSGSLVEHASKVGAGDYVLNVHAVDGSESAPQSGVANLSIAIDGRSVDTIKTSCPRPTGVPSAECYGLSGSWTMEGERYGTGAHTITVKATDWEGNESTETLHVTVAEAGYAAVGPGSVNLQTGNFKLTPTDVNIASGTGALTLARSYESRNPTAGSGGPLGPQWSLSLPDAAAVGIWRSLQVEPNGNVAATLTSGMRISFARSGNSFISPAGYQTETLTGSPAENPSEYKLGNAAGDQTIFTHAEHEEEGIYTPAGVVQASGAGGLNKVSYAFEKTTEGIVEPTAVIAPSPTGLECVKEFVKGCRELTFNYATSTTATGEAPEEWGDYKGHLTRVYLHAWNPKAGEKGEMTTTTVAQYSYDSKGRLRAEWDPQTEPEPEKCVGHPLAHGCLVTIYGYDEEGHITAITIPGQETWTLTYGTVAGDTNEGRLIKVLQAPASTSLWKGEAIASTEAPKLSGSPAPGVRMAIIGGKWSGNPVAYAYRWEDCDSEGYDCSTIAGADNGNYTPTSKDLGYSIVGQIIATNGSGSMIASTSPSTQVSEPGESLTVTKLSSTFQCPTYIAAGPESTIWFADLYYCVNNEIGKITSSLEVTPFSFAGVSKVMGITEGPSSTIWLTEESASKIVKLTSSGTIVAEYSLPTGSKPTGIINGPKGELWFAEYGTSKIGKITTTGEIKEYSLPEPGNYPGPSQLTEGPEGNVWFTEQTANKIGEINTMGHIVGEYSLPAGSKPGGITKGPDGNLWFTEEASSKIGKITKEGAVTEYALPASSDPQTITAGPEGDLRFTEYGANKLGQITTSGEINEFALGPNGTPTGVVTEGNAIWFTEYLPDAIGRLNTKETVHTTEGEAVASQPGWTMEYNVPLSGSGAPHEMSSSEVAKWAQKDDPISATAILPQSESKSQGWPASSYPQATIYYLDGQERTVNVANPAGGVSTTEYNPDEGVERTLSADDRASALKEGSKSAEVAEHLSTESKYSVEGTELTSTLGPEHKIKLPTGEEVQARKHTSYSYDEGAPKEGGPYYLPTKTTETAKLASGQEKDERVVTDSYSGQENLGWKLSTPTSTTTAANGLRLTHTTLYSATTGATVETRAPHSEEIKEYALPSGSDPWGITVGPESNLWFTDAGSGKVSSITATGTIKEYAANKNAPVGITSGPDGNLWFTELLSSNVNHVTTSGTLTTHTLTRSGADTMGITTGSDKNLWFTEYGASYIGKINTKSEVLGEYVLPSKSDPVQIVSGPDGNLWFTDEGTSKIGKITTSGTITEYALPTGSKPFSIVSGPEKCLWFTEPGTSKIGKITTSGTITEYAASAGEPRSITAGPENELWYTASKANKIAEFTPSGETTEYSLPADSSPWGITAAPESTIWFTDEESNKIGRIQPKAQKTGNQRAENSQIIYYSAGTEASIPACQNHREWANLPCQTLPAHQPEVSGLPELPVTTYSYNLYDEPEVTKSTSGSSTRTETDTYDAAGRLLSKELAASVGQPMTKVSYQYNAETGALEKQKAGEHTITSLYNTLGELSSYTDGNEGTSTYKYNFDGQVTEEATPYGTQTYNYNETTGLGTKLTDNAAGTFTATYDAEGDMASETLPNGLTACYTRNPIGEATGLEYRKASSCESGSAWFTDSVVPTVHGQWASQTSSLSTESYAYDEAGRLTEVKESPAGKGCTVRLYGLDEDGNRTSLTTRAPGTEGKCATEGGTTQTHTYDTANRLTDTGTQYNAFGDITSLPANDAGGSVLESAYYADGQLAEQRQEGVTQGYQLDPARRIAEITTTSSKVDSNVIDHYSSGGDWLSWSTEPGGKWTRYIAGISGELEAFQTDAETPVLQLSDLHGDIIGTAADEEAATKLLSSTNSTEYGVPTTGSPPRYSWLGTQELPTEFPSGVVAMGARSYVPQLGRFLQPDPKPGGSANAYAYTYGNPLNESDPSGQWSLNETSGGLSAVGAGVGTPLPGGTGIAAGAIMPAPVNTQLEAAFWASPPWDQETAGNEEYEEYEEEGEEEGEEEYASYHQGSTNGEGEPQMESGAVSQPLEGTAIDEAGERIFVLGGCPNIHDPCYPKHSKSGKHSKKSTKKSKKKCEEKPAHVVEAEVKCNPGGGPETDSPPGIPPPDIKETAPTPSPGTDYPAPIDPDPVPVLP